MAQSSVVIQRNCEGILQGDAFTQAREQHRRSDAEFSRPIADALRLPEGSQESSARAVARLFMATTPAAIFWNVANRVIYAVNRVIERRTRPHIIHEILKRGTPTVADGNTSTAITCVGVHARVATPSNHGSIGAVFGTSRHPMAFRQRGHTLTLVASARFLATLAKVIARNGNILAAIAYATNTIRGAARTWDVSRCCESAGSLRQLHPSIVTDFA